jgi:hypothetical protein
MLSPDHFDPVVRDLIGVSPVWRQTAISHRYALLDRDSDYHRF